jgi:hypothetical protein
MQHAVARHAEVVRRQQGLDMLMRVGLNSGEMEDAAALIVLNLP